MLILEGIFNIALCDPNLIEVGSDTSPVRGPRRLDIRLKASTFEDRGRYRRFDGCYAALPVEDVWVCAFVAGGAGEADPAYNFEFRSVKVPAE